MSSATLYRPMKQGDGRYHWTVDTFYRAVAAGVFDEPNRLELVNGDLWVKEPMNPPHASLTRLIARLLRRLMEPTLLVMQESPLHLATDGEPVPDVFVVSGIETDYIERHPTAAEAVLVIEVADTSVDKDTGDKAHVYAAAGITDYWVSVIGTRQLRVYRNPSPDGYPEPLVLTENDTIRPLAAPDVAILVRNLLAPAPSHNSEHSPHQRG